MVKTRGNPYLNFLDRYLGIFLVAFLSLFKKKQPFPRSLQTIGLLKLSGIGDLIVLSGVIKDIKIRYPHAHIILFCGAENQAIAPFITGVSQIKVLPLLNPLQAIKILRQKPLDLLLDCEQWSRIDVLLTFFSKSLYTIGFKTERQHRHFLFDACAHHSPLCHEIDNFRKIALCADVPCGNGPSLSIHSSPVVPTQKPFVIFHPWSISRMKAVKEWPEERWVELGGRLLQAGFEIFITGGKNDQVSSARLSTHIGAAVSLAGKTSFPELADYLRKAACVISVDTGIMHFAAALHVPLIALFGPTSSKRWGPLSAQAITLSSSHPYMYLGFEVPKQPPRCMEEISVDQVFSAFQKMQ